MVILIIGGYGVFGGRLARLLSDVAGLEIIIAGRDAARAEAFHRTYRGAAKTTPLLMDRGDVANVLRRRRIDLVVDASGPFQAYGDDPYGVVRACIDARVDYLDLADGAAFVAGIARFDQAARDAGVFVMSGVSSFPVLTAAVLREMAKRMAIETIEGGIAPSPYAGVGANVMRAVIGYAGERVRLRRDGRDSHGVALGESRTQVVAVPGRIPLRATRFSLVDVPDLRVLPMEHPGAKDVWMGAGPVPEILHRGLNLLAQARALLGLPSFAPLAGTFQAVLNAMRFGEHRGGMYVRATGRGPNGPTEASWHLLADGDDGPLIPSMAIEAIVRGMLDGRRPPAGARPGTRALELEDYERMFARRTIHTGFRFPHLAGTPPFREVLDGAADRMPASLRRIHDTTIPRTWTGASEIERGDGLIARLVGRSLGFPAAGRDVPVSVTMTPTPSGERWTRTFGDTTFRSEMSAGKGKRKHLLIERFGAVRIALALVATDDGLAIVPRAWSLWGMPLPRWAMPGTPSHERAEGDGFRFDVRIESAVTGLIVAYKGVLQEPEA